MVWVTRNGTKIQIPRKLSHHIPSMPIWSAEAFQEQVPLKKLALAGSHFFLRCARKRQATFFISISHVSKERQTFLDIDSEEFQFYKRAAEEEYRMQVFYLCSCLPFSTV